MVQSLDGLCGVRVKTLEAAPPQLPWRTQCFLPIVTNLDNLIIKMHLQ